MTAVSRPKYQLPDGPADAFDINTSAESFSYLQDMLARYGAIFAVKALSRQNPSIVVNQPDYLKHILISNNKNYLKGVGFERVKMLLGNGIIVSDGPFWRRQRRMVQPAFNKDIIEQVMKLMKLSNQQLLQRWQSEYTTNPVINITDTTNELALEIILRAIFGKDFDALLDADGSHPFSILTESSARDLQLVVKFRALTRQVQAIIEQRRHKASTAIDFLGVFMEARDKETGEFMTDKELIDEIMTLIVAGSETSAATMNWSWYLLAQHPEIEAHVHQVVDQASYTDAPTMSDLEELAYIRQVIEEALRLYPPVWLFSRKAIKDDHVGEYLIPAGADIFIAPYFLHRRPDLWPEPESFDPQRFSAEQVKERHKLAYIPFSAGPRRCIGDFFGITEVMIHIAMVARHFKLEWIPEQTVELEPAINLRTRHPMMMKLVKR